jgi:hypothetical protein
MTKLFIAGLAQIPTTRGKTLSMANFVAHAEMNLRAKSRRAS